jgi:hypothetical protein
VTSCGDATKTSLGWVTAVVVPASYVERVQRGSGLRVKALVRFISVEW